MTETHFCEYVKEEILNLRINTNIKIRLFPSHFRLIESELKEGKN